MPALTVSISVMYTSQKKLHLVSRIILGRRNFGQVNDLYLFYRCCSYCFTQVYLSYGEKKMNFFTKSLFQIEVGKTICSRNYQSKYCQIPISFQFLLEQIILSQ